MTEKIARSTGITPEQRKVWFVSSLTSVKDRVKPGDILGAIAGELECLENSSVRLICTTNTPSWKCQKYGKSIRSHEECEDQRTFRQYGTSKSEIENKKRVQKFLSKISKETLFFGALHYLNSITFNSIIFHGCINKRQIREDNTMEWEEFRYLTSFEELSKVAEVDCANVGETRRACEEI